MKEIDSFFTGNYCGYDFQFIHIFKNLTIRIPLYFFREINFLIKSDVIEI